WELASKAESRRLMAESVVRLDTWLWAARFFKTRALASEAVAGGKVELNGTRAKRAKQLRVGDRLRVRKGPVDYQLTVRQPERHARAPRRDEGNRAIAWRNRRCCSLRSATSRFQARASAGAGSGGQLLPARGKANATSRVSRRRTMYFQYAVCSTISQMLCRPRRGRHNASRCDNPRSAPHNGVPCHAR